jgi:two-component system, OmpR family, phosphate regulon sensor histidine kinase PhoR
MAWLLIAVFQFCCVLLAWWLGDWRGPAALAWLAWLIWGLHQTKQLHAVDQWLKSPLETPAPKVWGWWADLVYRAYRSVLRSERRVEQESGKLRTFLEAIQASPNGIVILDAESRVEWCNTTASHHLGLDMQRDHMQHIVHIVRDPAFHRYVHQGNHAQELQMDGRSETMAHAMRLSVQLHAYGEGRNLLLSRDITALNQAETMRRDFVANVSHEIRTPLTVIYGYIETLQSLPLSEEEKSKYLQSMATQAARMQNLVSDLLVLSQLEGSPMPGVARWFALNEVLGAVLDDAKALSATLHPSHVMAHDIELHRSAWADQADDLELSGERSELISAFGNLVNNAVRYTPAGGRIVVKVVRLDDGALTFSVQDTGPGIAPEHLPRLTERFYRVDRSRSRETGGTGLGLAIVKHVVQRHQGQLTIDSEQGKGSVFSIRFGAERVRGLERSED